MLRRFWSDQPAGEMAPSLAYHVLALNVWTRDATALRTNYPNNMGNSRMQVITGNYRRIVTDCKQINCFYMASIIQRIHCYQQFIGNAG